MRQYLDALSAILEDGDRRGDRTGVGTLALFGVPLTFDLREGFPTVTTKKLFFKTMARELLWFISGSSDISILQEQGVHIWDDDVSKEAWQTKARFPTDAGRIYGVQWRGWTSPDGRYVDQLAEVIEGIKQNPFGRRHVVTAWNPGEISQMALPPCHMFYQFSVSSDGRLSLNMYQRSCDMMLGVPFNIASYALLLSMVAQVADLQPGTLKLFLGDAHIYLNHLEGARRQISREPLPLPTLWLNPEVRLIDEFTMDDIELRGYECHPHIKLPLNTG